MTTKPKIAIYASIALLFIITAIYAISYYRTYYRNNIDCTENEYQVKIFSDFCLDDIIETLCGTGMILNRRSLEKAASKMNLGNNFKSGNYVFSAPMSNKAIIRSIANRWQKPVRIAFPGYVRSLEKFAGVLGDKFEADSASFANILLDTGVMAKYGFDEKTFIGMFIPNTYEMWWTVTPEEFVERMHKEYDFWWTTARKEKAAGIGLTQNEVSTLASIVIEESKFEPELPIIAGVYINRLKKGMPLQADPTVKFAVNDSSIRRILTKHLQIDSPYNTYKHTGLPPGPITMPPTAALDAVLNYSHHNYLYFCAKETFDGQHNFASTLAQHNANARKYHQALNAIGRK